MGSKFENFDLGRAAAALIKTRDPKNFPTEINTDQLQPVLSIPLLPQDIVIPFGLSLSGALTGLSLQEFPLLGGTVGITQVTPTPSYSAKQEHQLLALNLTVSMSGADATLDVGKSLTVQIALVPDNAALFYSVYPLREEFALVDAATVAYDYTYPVGTRQKPGSASFSVPTIVYTGGRVWDGFIPAGYRCSVFVGIRLSVGTDTTWRGSATISGSFLMASRAESMFKNT